ncbi:PREDICTED: uncharacterized protein LOC105961530 [Erythranthe guttata]|uniref:uncharacterized protein LOC105961530 n=1 Tax=Erythranthe guttata TaxID=4155 RepID=UPI00064D7A5D|nr:PREDICTED: uncharacterized protein LOC105961530 [Erythranthe guttata]|eukprot:XP_012841213.1 PREDICTED: uncharacterized protein LOC105961530 [Erythranthe guttata]
MEVPRESGLPNALWAYRTTPRTATGESPFNLAFGTEAVAPVEIGEPSWRVINYSLEANEEAMKANLDLVDELREIASIRQQMYQSCMAKVYNSKVRPRSFQVGDLVLRRAEASRPIGKLDPKWEGPYKITQVVNNGAYRLENLDGHPIPRTWNIGNLKSLHLKPNSKSSASLLQIITIAGAVVIHGMGFFTDAGDISVVSLRNRGGPTTQKSPLYSSFFLFLSRNYILNFGGLGHGDDKSSINNSFWGVGTGQPELGIATALLIPKRK